MKEKLSALMDGELDLQEVDGVLAYLKFDQALLQDWVTWQASADSLKGAGIGRADFIERFSRRLENEPVLDVHIHSRQSGG